MQEGMSLPKYESNRGTTHFARIAWAILGPCMDVLREVLAKEISPPVLEKKVKDYISENRKPSISEKQKQLVYSKKYSDFDITLLYFLFRNICSISQHENKWGKDPKPTDKGVSANIERVRILRNEWYGHATDFSLSDSDFKQKWTYISQIVKELECYLGTGTKYQDTLIKLKTCFMDPESIERYIDTLSTDITYLKEGFGELQTNVTNIKEEFGELQTDVTDIKEGVGELQTDVTDIKEGVGELQTDVTYIKEGFGEFQTDFTSLKEDVEEIKKTNEKYSTQESHMEKCIFNQWEQDDSCFISTKACKEVEKMIKSSNLVIVAGHSGSGKSAIIQHIALKYREQGWTIKRVKEVKDIVDEYSSGRFQKNKTICVFNDPLGKESFNEILNNSWQKYREELELYLKSAKVVMSCRSHIIRDARLTRYLVNQSNVVNIDDKETKLSVKEKRQILTKYMSNVNLSDEDRCKILEVETYFPLLCKLYSSKEEYKHKGIEFFTEPVTVLKEEIIEFRKKDKGKYCALALLVLFNDDLCVRNLLNNQDTEYKFKHTLKLCGLPKNTPPSAIIDNLSSLKDFLVKKVGNMYHFYHDLVMEVTTYVLGTDYPTETIKYADIGFLRRRVALGNCEEHNDSFIVYLNDGYKEELGERFFTELLGERFLDVVLNPCLRNQTVTEIMKKKISDHPKYIQKLLETKQLTVYKQDLDGTSEDLFLTKLSFLNLEKEVSPLFALIVFCHTQLSQYCVNTLQQQKTCFLISAICCNGSIELFFNVFKDHGEGTLEKTWGVLCPIHIVSVFHNYELLNELIKIGVKVNQKTDGYAGWTPLMLAACNDTREYRDINHEKSGAERRDITVQLLLSNGADINLCKEGGASPLYIACKNGHDSTVQLLLSNGADINLCEENGASPLYIACVDGHDSTVQLLLSNGADIKLCEEGGASPLYIACQNGHDSTVQLLLNNGADINLCLENGASPLYIACQNGHDSTVQLLLNNGADIKMCKKGGVSPLCIACFDGHDSTVQLLLSNGADINLCEEGGASPLYIACQNGHDSTVQLLLSNGADINLCEENGASPLYIACLNGHDSTVKLLLSNGADINLCEEDGASPLYIACKNGHDVTVQLLLNNGADIKMCKKGGVSPLCIACFEGHDSTVHLLLKNGADINLCAEYGASPLYIACENGHDGTVQLLLSNGADINLCLENGASPLYIACKNGHDSTVQLLLSNGADINLCAEYGTSPLYIACKNGHDSTVQLLLSNGADINLCEEDGASPLYIACLNGHDSTVKLLLSNGADINLCEEDGASPLGIACFNGHDVTVQLLLSNGADINLCLENGTCPLCIACYNGHDSTVQLLLSNGADINLCDKNGPSPLQIACYNGHDSTVQLLLSNGADINLCTKVRVSPIIFAFVNRHYKTVNILLNNDADSSLACGWEVNPALVDCFDKQDCTVVFLLQKDNISNHLYDPDSYFSLFVSCQVERAERMIFLERLNGFTII
ncbi:uncharacterized protein [Magallana gigas]|uniref:uncharacterized protein isoform X2 n=1 Tax=Magallana gigas TaxID=29159 RepID=UPI003341C359